MHKNFSRNIIYTNMLNGNYILMTSNFLFNISIFFTIFIKWPKVNVLTCGLVKFFIRETHFISESLKEGYKMSENYDARKNKQLLSTFSLSLLPALIFLLLFFLSPCLLILWHFEVGSAEQCTHIALQHIPVNLSEKWVPELARNLQDRNTR